MVREPAPSCARRRRLYYDPDYQHRARTPYLTNLYAPEIIINKRRKTRDIAVIYDSALTAQRTNGSRLIIALLPLLECKIAWPAINIYNAAPSLRLIFALGSRLFKHSRLDNAYRASRKNNELLQRFHVSRRNRDDENPLRCAAFFERSSSDGLLQLWNRELARREGEFVRWETANGEQQREKWVGRSEKEARRVKSGSRR